MNKVITNSFEGIEQVTKGAANQAKKVVEDVARDVQESIVGDIKPISDQERQQLEQRDQKEKDKNIAQVRQNLKSINEEMLRIKKERQQNQSRQTQVDNQQKVQKKMEKKKEDSALMQMIKSRKGTKEGMKGASG
jgi:hypothetical protein